MKLVITLLMLACLGYTVDSPAQTDSLGTANGIAPDSLVNVAFGRKNLREITGSVSVVNTTAATRLDYVPYVGNFLNGRVPGMIGSNNIRGIGIGIDIADLTGSGLLSGNAMYIVDGLPRDIEGLRTSEIESITVLKDVNAAVLYGSAAMNGVIMITTKRGQANQPSTTVSINRGVGVPQSLPKYLNSADYMEYFNIARANDGLSPQYSAEMINNYRTGNPYRYPSVDYYSRDYLRSGKAFSDIMTEFSGGDENARFYANVGWNSSGSLMNFGEGGKGRNDIFNVRGNVDLKVNDWISTAIDATAFFGRRRDSRSNYWSAAGTVRPHEFAPLIPFDLIDPENVLLKGRKNDVDGKYLLGGTTNFLSNAIADSYSAGSFEAIYRKFSFNNRVNFDLAQVTPGLSAQTNVSFDYLTGYNQTVPNQYSVYTPTWSDTEDRIVSLTQHGQDTRPGTQVVGNAFFRRRFGFYGQLVYDRTFSDLHHFSGRIVGFGSQFKETGDFQGVKQAHLGFQAAYTFDRRYSIDFSGALVNSTKLAEGNRIGFSPTVGLAWIASSEDFLAGNSVIDYLKVRLSAGMLKSDQPIGGFFYYDSRYNTSGSYNWFEGGRSRSGVRSAMFGNVNLGFASRDELNLGIETRLLDNRFGFETNLFYSYYNKLVTRPTSEFPSFYNDFISYQNFEADRYTGADLNVTYDESFGDWRIGAGANLLLVTSERMIVAETYDYEYLNRKGLPKDATFGLEALGLFQSQAEIDNSPRQMFGTVRPGDIKYKDQNGDGFITANDEVYLRRYQAPVSGALQLRVGYKNLNFFLLGEARFGVKNFRESSYFWLDGNKKYSEMALKSWTPETAQTAEHPRLSSATNSNNHRRSTYWLYSDNYFQLRRMQVTYDFSPAFAGKLSMRNLRAFVNAGDLFQFAANKEIRKMRIQSEPAYHSFSVGVTADF